MTISQLTKRFSEDCFTSRSECDLLYRLHIPQSQPGVKHPLLLFLHGVGERGSDNKLQLVNGIGSICTHLQLKKLQPVIVAPQCPPDDFWVATEWAARRHSMSPEPTRALAAVLELVHHLSTTLPVDKKRIYITGLSMGGFGTWECITREPSTFAAAVPVCGGADENFASRIRKLPIWAFHGTLDTDVPVIRSRRMVKALQAQGGSPRYTELSYVYHNAWTPAYSIGELYDWLFAQSR